VALDSRPVPRGEVEVKRSSVKLCVLAVPVAAVLLSLAPAGASGVGAECNWLADCVAVEDNPWVSVGAADASTSHPGEGLWEVQCSSGGYIGVGYDYVPGNPAPANLSVLVAMAHPGVGPTPLSLFQSYNFQSVPVSYKPLLGCIPSAPAGAAAATRAAPRLRLVLRTVRLRAAERRTYRHRCPGGHALVRSGSGVGFFTRRPPSLRTLRQLEIRHRQRSGVVETTVITGPRVGDDERVVLQQHAVCRRR
jgi:hypothetical protein